MILVSGPENLFSHVYTFASDPTTVTTTATSTKYHFTEETCPDQSYVGEPPMGYVTQHDFDTHMFHAIKFDGPSK